MPPEVRLEKIAFSVIQQTGSIFRRLFFVLVCAAPLTAHGQSCTPDRTDEQVQIGQVYDGDTVKLSDGRKLRLIGIDTPEIGHGNRPSQPLAVIATQTLRKLLATSPNLRLRLDAELKDNYQRMLAHLYLQNGTSVEATLLEKGLATVLTVPPNVWNLACYQAAEQRARTARLGIWSLPAYQPVDVATLPARADGFRFIKGHVVRVGKSRKSIWLNLNDNVSLRIDRADLPYFKGYNLERMENRQVVARGWLHPQARGSIMRIRHPAGLEWTH